MPTMNVQVLFLVIPFTFLLHILEEWCFGFPEWARRRFGSITTRKFYVLSHIPILATVTAASIIAARPHPNKIAVSIALLSQAALFVNGLFHLRSSFKYREYSPGVVSSVLFNIPFTAALFVLFWRTGLVSQGRIIGAIVMGAIVSVVIVRSLNWKRVI